MEFKTSIIGYQLICIKEYEDALHRIQEISTLVSPLRASLLHDIQILDEKNKNSFAKSIRLLDKFNKLTDTMIGVRL